MLLTEEVRQEPERKESTRHKPKIIKWKGVSLIRSHSFLATVREIIDWSEEIDVTRIGIIGDPHSGKTTMGKAIAHAIHEYAKIPYSIRFFEKEDLLNFKQTLKSLTPVNHILVFGDLSFMGGDTNRKQIELVKQATTQIRHLPGGQDVKIIIIYDYHYLLGLDKYLRQADFKYITTVGSSEGVNLLNMVGKQYAGLIHDFQKYRQNAVVRKVWKIRISNKEYHAYKFRNPWIPALFFNNDSMRLIISPEREFMDPVCSKCLEAEGKIPENSRSLEEISKQLNTNFGLKNVESAIKLDMYVNGLTTYGKHIIRALKSIERVRKERTISLEQLAKHYGIEPTVARLRKPIQTELIPLVKS